MNDFEKRIASVSESPKSNQASEESLRQRERANQAFFEGVRVMFRSELRTHIKKEVRRFIKLAKSYELPEIKGPVAYLGILAETAKYMAAIEQEILRSDENENFTMPASVTRMPFRLALATRSFLSEFQKRRERIASIVATTKPEDMYYGLVKTRPIGAIKQSRFLNALVWEFENPTDIKSFFSAGMEEGDPRADRKAQQIGGSVSHQRFRGEEIAIVAVRKNASASIRTHEGRHVLFHETSKLRQSFEAGLTDEQTFLEDLSENWGDKLKNEILAYFHEGLSRGYADLRALTDFASEGRLYDYPDEDQNEAKGFFLEHSLGSARDFSIVYQQAANKYFDFARDVIERLTVVFSNEEGWDIVHGKRKTKGGRTPGFVDMFNKDGTGLKRQQVSALRQELDMALRVFEFFPIQSWPDLLDRIDHFEPDGIDWGSLAFQMLYVVAEEEEKERAISQGKTIFRMHQDEYSSPGDTESMIGKVDVPSDRQRKIDELIEEYAVAWEALGDAEEQWGDFARASGDKIGPMIEKDQTVFGGSYGIPVLRSLQYARVLIADVRKFEKKLELKTKKWIAAAAKISQIVENISKELNLDTAEFMEPSIESQGG